MNVISLFKKPQQVEETELADELDVVEEDQEAGEPATEEETERQAAVREMREAFSEAIARLWQGSRWMCHGCAQGLAAWCRNGRRDDLDGAAAEYGVWGRGIALLVGGGVVWKLVDAAPVLLVPAAGIWVLAALYAKEPPEPVEKSEEEGEQEGEGEAPVEPPVIALVRAEIGAEKGVHLGVLYPAMRGGLPGAEEAPDEALRQLLREHQIPTRRSVRAGGISGRSGVHRDDLPPLPSKELSKSGATPLSTGGDAGQSTRAESGVEGRRGAGEGSERGGEATARLIQDPENPARWTVVQAS
ncbi:hypothetical protein JGS39_29095 [Streptomyces sp. P01-B04]|nr:hypothetical protein [Streptomyces poriferorum]MBW5252985.1 hypothetical protein [Streptomyces poriferorum]